MSKLTIQTDGGSRIIEFDGSVSLRKLLDGAGIITDYPCGGTGTCGKCMVHASGRLNPSPDSDGRIKICMTTVAGDASVLLTSQKPIRQIVTAPVDIVGAVDKHAHFGIAADIGTTTVALAIAELESGKIIVAVGCENLQIKIAADVIGRAGAAVGGMAELLKTMIHDTLASLEAEACRIVGIDASHIDKRVITGNTVMLSLYHGTDMTRFTEAPFRAENLFGYRDGDTYYPPCADTFVGADIVCGIIASGIIKEEKTALFLDVGTNSETVLVKNGKMYCTSAAAGPAFEGSGIACGSQASDGAVDAVTVVNDKLSVHTIGGKRAESICGSGIIDAVAALLESGELDDVGALDSKQVNLTDAVYITQSDIRAVQLAKAAISAGCTTLMKFAGVNASDIGSVYIAGGFGKHLNPMSIARIGMLPYELAPKIKFVGNTSLAGAVMLLDESRRAAAEAIASEAVCLNLAETDGFAEQFVRAMRF